MKHFLFILGLFCTSLISAQTYITVDHDGTPILVQDLKTALDTAQNGDDIYIPGGSFNIGDILVNKQIRLFGVGHYPAENTLPTELYGTITLTKDASNTFITGIYLSGNLLIGNSDGNPNNIQITRTSVNKLYTSSSVEPKSNNVLLSECVIRGGSYEGSVVGNYSTNTFVEKCIINSYIENFSNTIFNNCIFLFNVTNSWATLGYTNPPSIKNCEFNNNIFIDPSALRETNSPATSPQNCIFNNNVFCDSISFPYYTSTGNNNLFNIDMSTVFVKNETSGFSYSNDYHLAEGFEGISAGNDGFDVGIYGTGMPYKENAIPIQPRIKSSIVTVKDNVLKLTIDVEAQKQ